MNHQDRFRMPRVAAAALAIAAVLGACGDDGTAPRDTGATARVEPRTDTDTRPDPGPDAPAKPEPAPDASDQARPKPKPSADEQAKPDASGSDRPESDSLGRPGAQSGASESEQAAPVPVVREAADIIVDLQYGDLLDTVIARGYLNCGVSGAATAFSETQPDGSQTGFDADYCRAVAAAIFGYADAAVFYPLTAAERFTAVQTGEVDMLMRNTTWTQSRDTEVGMDFGPTTYYDGQQLMARAGDGFSGSSQLSDIAGAVVCTNAGTTTELNIADAAEAAGIQIQLTTFEDFDQVTEYFLNGTCDVITTDGSALVGRKASQQPAGENWVIFPATPISKEPLGPVYSQNQSRFADVVNWTVYATIIADEKGITSANVAAMAANPPDAEAARLLGVANDEQQSNMGLWPDAFYQVIAQVGNYDEIYSRNLNPVGLTREGSLNAGWLDGGLMFAPPAR